MNKDELRWKIVEYVIRLDIGITRKEQWELIEDIYRYVTTGKK